MEDTVQHGCSQELFPTRSVRVFPKLAVPLDDRELRGRKCGDSGRQPAEIWNSVASKSGWWRRCDQIKGRRRFFVENVQAPCQVAIKKTAFRTRELNIMTRLNHGNILCLLVFMWGEENPEHRRHYFAYHFYDMYDGKWRQMVHEREVGWALMWCVIVQLCVGVCTWVCVGIYFYVLLLLFLLLLLLFVFGVSMSSMKCTWLLQWTPNLCWGEEFTLLFMCNCYYFIIFVLTK